MDQNQLSKMGKIVLQSSEKAVKSIFNKVSEKVENIKELSEVEQALLKFGIEAFDYFEQRDEIPQELENDFIELKRRIDNMENK